MNLLSSFADDSEDSARVTVDGIEMLDDDEDSDWLGEYQRGCDWEIYTTSLSEQFEGMAFSVLSEILYQRLGVVLFALEVEDLYKDRANAKLLLNPANFVIPPRHRARVEAFVFAKNKAQSDLSFSKSSPSQLWDSAVNLALLAQNALRGVTMALNNGDGEGVVAPQGGVSNPAEQLMNVRDAKEQKQAWQMLLNKHRNNQSSETQQEEKQKEQDKVLRSHFYVREADSGAVDILDACIKTNVMEELPYVENHIIIIGKALNNLYDLILPLRSRSLGPVRHIIIMYPYDFPAALWQRICIFSSISILRGSALEEADMYRAGIFKAKHVIVLAEAAAANVSAKAASAAGELDALVDADAVFCYQCIRHMNESAHVVVEVVKQTNVSYMDPEGGALSIDYKFSPQFASGALIVSSLLDTIACQVIFILPLSFRSALSQIVYSNNVCSQIF
jgi:hypothetical protein